jgi:hypothetical protein
MFNSILVFWEGGERETGSFSPQPKAGGPPLVACSRFLIQHTRSYLLRLEAVSSICNLRTRPILTISADGNLNLRDGFTVFQWAEDAFTVPVKPSNRFTVQCGTVFIAPISMHSLQPLRMTSVRTFHVKQTECSLSKSFS